MERGSDKVSPRVDEELKHELQQTLRGDRQSRAEEWRQAEPSGEDQPDVDRVPDGTLLGGVPVGMSQEDVAVRSELATFLNPSSFPATGSVILDSARSNEAPDAVVDRLSSLPAGRTYLNVQEVWADLGGGVEEVRT